MNSVPWWSITALVVVGVLAYLDHDGLAMPGLLVVSMIGAFANFLAYHNFTSEMIAIHKEIARRGGPPEPEVH